MGCKVQVHEKTDKRGTWTYHSVNGWYLSTSSEHYRTQKCHIKATSSNRYSDTVQFQHKNITNPTVTPYNKLMHAIADCAKAIKGFKNAMKDEEKPADKLEHQKTDAADTRIIEGEARREEEKTK